MTEKVEILQMGPYPDWDEEALGQAFAVHRWFEVKDKPSFLAAHGGTIRAIATRGELGADKALIDALPRLEIISIYGVGFDAVDLETARRRGIKVTNTPGILTKDVADFGVAMMLCLGRDMVGAEAWVRSGDWARRGAYPLKTSVTGKRAGILGLGRIGREIARRLEVFDMEVLYCDLQADAHLPKWTFIADPKELAARSDVFFVTLAASAATRHVVNREVVEALGSSGMLINVSRASNIDEAALLDALESGALGAAALDVFEGEPALNPRFLTLKNVLLQPHHSSATVETRKAMGRLVRENLTAHFDGLPLLTPVL